MKYSAPNHHLSLQQWQFIQDTHISLHFLIILFFYFTFLQLLLLTHFLLRFKVHFFLNGFLIFILSNIYFVSYNKVVVLFNISRFQEFRVFHFQRKQFYESSNVTSILKCLSDKHSSTHAWVIFFQSIDLKCSTFITTYQ